jgi:cytochrome c oxidase subunit 2
VDPDQSNGKPVLYLPVNETVHFHLQSRDVIHSFWVPAFLFKRDILPGEKTGEDFQITPTRLGTYQGRCAELCGVDHSRMLFEVKIVTPQQFQQYIATHQASGSTQ